MGSRKVFLAADIGAGSGRVIAGVLQDGKISLEEVNRFDNPSIDLDGSLHWQSIGILSSIKEGLALAIKKYGDDVRSIGVDTWGVDYGFLDKRKRLLGVPYCYRDSRTEGMIEEANQTISASERYAATGIQPAPYNTLYQLLAEQKGGDSWLELAGDLLFMPDLINFWLSGVACNEVTIASTSEMLDAKTGEWARELLFEFGFPKGIFESLVEPGVVLGPLTKSIQSEIGASDLKVVTVPSHDTAAAVASCPFSSDKSIFISSGTWSLMGIESDEPFLTESASESGLTNERGVEGTTRLLKNISGFWIFQECKRDWDSKGVNLSYAELTDLAENAEPFKLFINPNDRRFMKPGKMLERIGAYLKETGQEVTEDPAAISRAIFEGLVFSYREAIAGLEKVTGTQYDTINIIGGGSQNLIINQFVADATGCRVIAGPIEGSSLGNILAQIKAEGDIDSIRAGRTIINDSFELPVFEPNDSNAWIEAEKKFKEILGVE
ncbi:rhamnulokinase [Puniceicoccaceae bacterium K14]|nr:rhamnulokinase [Puniceicoccaceae bacterium K14]